MAIPRPAHYPIHMGSWSNFYVIVGSSAGALTGLQFVVITLVAQSQHSSSMREIRAFGSPTVVHFCLTLLVSALMCMPWRSAVLLAWMLAAVGVAGLIYGASVVYHARKQTGYEPEPEDWLWYIVAPLILYGALIAAGVLLLCRLEAAFFVTAAVALGLLFLGIRNSWDTVTYVAITRSSTS